MIGIIGAMEEEINTLKERMIDVEIVEYADQRFLKGTLQNQNIVLVQSGIGKVNATITVTLLKQLFDVNYIINTGSAGALDPALKIGDILIAHSLAYSDVDVTAFDYEFGQMAGMPALYQPDSQLVRQAQEACRQAEIEPYIGLIVSGDQFIHSPVQKRDILSHFPQARGCEMESTAIAQACYVLDIPFVIIRAISDLADGKASITFDEFLVEASQISALIVEMFLELQLSK